MFQARIVPLVVSLAVASSAFCQEGAPAPFASLRAKDLFDKFTGVLSSAKSIKVQFDAQTLGQASESYELLFARPNVGYVKSGSIEVYMDGKTITVYNPKKNTYYQVPETAANFPVAFGHSEYGIWRLFFQPKALSKVFQIRSNGSKSRKGMTMQVIEIQSDSENRSSLTLYTDPQDSQLRQAEFTRQDLKKKAIILIDVRDFKTNVDTNPDDFSFEPPAGAMFKKP